LASRFGFWPAWVLGWPKNLLLALVLGMVLVLDLDFLGLILSAWSDTPATDCLPVPEFVIVLVPLHLPA